MADESPDRLEQEIIRERKRRAKRRQDDNAAVLERVIQSADTRQVLWNILEMTGIYQSSFGGGNDLTNFREGKRAIGLTILADLCKVDPNIYTLMRHEAERREQEWEGEVNG